MISSQGEVRINVIKIYYIEFSGHFGLSDKRALKDFD